MMAQSGKFDVGFAKILPKRQDNRGFPALADGEFQNDLFEALKKKYLPEPRPETSKKIWVSKDRRETPIEEMDTRHLINTIRMIEDGRHGRVKDGHELHSALRADLDWRKNLVKNFRKKTKQKKRSPGGVFFQEKEQE